MFKYFEKLGQLFQEIKTTDIKGKDIEISCALKASVSAIKIASSKGNKVMFIGNGGSASIASHLAVDLWKNGSIKAVSFNDGAQLTCLGNDFGYEHVFEKPIEFFSEPGDILIAISSSGKSENILRGVKAAVTRKCHIITMSGFSKNNPLRKMGSINFYVPSPSYGFVEITHLALCHSILDYITCK